MLRWLALAGKHSAPLLSSPQVSLGLLEGLSTFNGYASQAVHHPTVHLPEKCCRRAVGWVFSSAHRNSHAKVAPRGKRLREEGDAAPHDGRRRRPGRRERQKERKKRDSSRKPQRLLPSMSCTQHHLDQCQGCYARPGLSLSTWHSADSNHGRHLQRSLHLQLLPSSRCTDFLADSVNRVD